MPREQIVITDFDVTGELTDTVAEVDGNTVDNHYFINDTAKKVSLEVRNAHASNPLDVTVVVPGELETGLPYPDRVIEVPATKTMKIGGFTTTIYNQQEDPDALGTDSAVYFSVESSDLKIRAFRIT